MPRKGAWYPVVGEASADRLVLQVGGRKVAISRRLLETRPSRPDRFTVVYLTKEQLNRERETSGTQYAVCPACARRAPLFGEPVVMTCRSCGHAGDVAWWETG